jgi:nitrite reductase (NADH) small subunit
MRPSNGATRLVDGESWHVVGALDDFPSGSHRVLQVSDRSVGVFNIAGQLYALRNVCPHQAGPVCETKKTTGTLMAPPENGFNPVWTQQGEIIVCPWHGLEYHVPSGRCLADRQLRLRRYRVIVVADEVLLSLGAAPEPGSES